MELGREKLSTINGGGWRAFLVGVTIRLLKKLEAFIMMQYHFIARYVKLIKIKRIILNFTKSGCF